MGVSLDMPIRCLWFLKLFISKVLCGNRLFDGCLMGEWPNLRRAMAAWAETAAARKITTENTASMRASCRSSCERRSRRRPSRWR